MPQAWKPVIAELVGTAVFCFIGMGSICMNQWTTGEVGLAGIALAHGGALGLMIAVLGPLSGGHFNPAVTLGVLFAGRSDVRTAAAYVGAQLAGASLAALLLLLIVPPDIWGPVHLGAPALGPGVTVLQGTVMELALTFVLVLTVFGTAIDREGSRQALLPGLWIGLAVVVEVFVAGPMTGAALNPARAFGPALLSDFWTHHLVYWLSPVAGGVLAAMLASILWGGVRRKS
jgi:aquaporin Z